MYLSKLEIFGFKSFANRTQINFTKGITGIVGPNGCGKTNIVDAIRWCLGEQKSSTLRSDKMENVIFNGTKLKKSMGMSEVSLTMVNDEGLLPTEYSEVTITRRIFRSGESEYLLNKNLCRLKDITNLFMDTGMGTNAYSVIELKMIETILSSKADERRRMFEEAAGVNKYKLRRRLALKKLDEVKSDLTRVNDIVSEVEKQVRSLERQAKKADKYNQIQSVLREKELDWAEREYALSNANILRFTSQIEGFKTKKNNIDFEIRKTENDLIEFRNKISEVDSELSSKRLEISNETNLLHSVQQKISVSEERLKSLTTNIERYKQELEELRLQNDEIDETILENKSKIETLNRSNSEIEEKLSESESHVTELKVEVEEKQKNLRSYNEVVIEIYKKEESKKNSLANAQLSLQKNDEQISLLNKKIQNLTNNIAKTVGYLENLENEKTALSKSLEESEAKFVSKQKEKESLEKKLGKLKENELDQKSAIGNLKNKIDFLQTLITNLEGISKGSKVLLDSRGWTDKDKNIFADVGSSQEKYRFAVEASLKNVLNNLLIENIDDLNKAVEYLNRNNLGKASFYLLNNEPDTNTISSKLSNYIINRKRKKIAREASFINWTSLLVETEDKWKPYFDKVLSNKAVVSDLKTALLLSKKYPEFSYATLNGDIVEKGGIIEAGSEPKLDDTLFGRKQLVENLKNEIPVLEQKLKEIQAEIDSTERAISSIDLKVISEEGKMLINDINNIEKQLNQFEFEKNKSTEEIDKTQDQIKEFAGESNRLNNLIEILTKEIAIVEEEKSTADKKHNELETYLRSSEEKLAHSVQNQNQYRLELERINGQIQNSDNSIERAEKTRENVSATIDKRITQIDSTKTEIEEIKTSLTEMQRELDEINGRRNVLIQQENEIEEKLKELKTEASKYESAVTEMRNERQELSDSIHEIDIKLNELRIRLEGLKDHIREEYNLELELKEFTDLDEFNFSDTKSEIENLKSQLKNLGPINLLAYSEYEEEKERMDFLHKQRDDLIDSEKDLVKTIHDINETAQEKFKETFEEIRANFVKIFRTLFDPGDEADLVIDENEDPLESKIEIIAKPKGKRPTSIELLSGGEKTLTATALLFAIYLVKPSPFCILDEVDAPLDDANIDRFTKLIKEFSSKTQFIIVTHNKRTMESAENMYGVTMQEEGVSKLAAVQFNEDLPVN